MFGGDTNVFVATMSNIMMNSSWKWKKTMREFVMNTIRYLEEYYRRRNSESEFAANKKLFGWSIARRGRSG